MKYFSSSEIFISLLYSVGFGLAFGILASLVAIVFDNIQYIVKIPYRAWRLSKKPSLVGLSEINSLKIGCSVPILSNIRDFIYTLTYGIFFILLIYVSCDGVLRAYSLIISIACSIIAYKLIGRYLRRFLLLILSRVFLVFTAILSVLMFFPRRAVDKAVIPLFLKIKEAFIKPVLKIPHIACGRIKKKRE